MARSRRSDHSRLRQGRVQGYAQRPRLQRSGHSGRGRAASNATPNGHDREGRITRARPGRVQGYARWPRPRRSGHPGRGRAASKATPSGRGRGGRVTRGEAGSRPWLRPKAKVAEIGLLGVAAGPRPRQRPVAEAAKVGSLACEAGPWPSLRPTTKPRMSDHSWLSQDRVQGYSLTAKAAEVWSLGLR